jgi:hypothetical protein
LLLLKPKTRHCQPDRGGDRRDRRAVVQRRGAMLQSGHRPVGVSDGQPLPVAAARHPLTCRVQEGRLPSVPAVDAQVPVTERLPQHRSQPVQAGQLPVSQQLVRHPGLGPDDGGGAGREGGGDHQQHELVAEQGQDGVEPGAQ